MVSPLANAKPTCDEVLSKCEKALDAQVEVNQLQKTLNEDLERLNRYQTEQLIEAREDLSKWYRDPVLLGLLSLSVGFGVGVVIGVSHGK